MFVQMTCGNCTSEITVDTDENLETMSLDLIHRFNEAHVECGFIAPIGSRSGDSLRKVRRVQPPETDDNE